MDCQAPLSMGFSRQEYWSVLPLPPPGNFPNTGIKAVSPTAPALADGFFTTEPPGSPRQRGKDKPVSDLTLRRPGRFQNPVALFLQSCLTLCNPMDCSRQVPLSMGILQARILEWVAMPSSRGSSQPRDRTQVFCIPGRFFTI